MAIVAAALALVAVSGHVNTTEELLAQSRASEQWAYYQGKAIRRYQSEFARDLLASVGNPAAAEAARKYRTNFERYDKEAEQIQERAHEFERESVRAGRRALRVYLGEIFLEIAIVLASLALLARRAVFWNAGVVSAVFGTAAAATALVVR